MKRLLSLLLSVVLVVSICPTAIASNAEHKAAADILYSLGLVSGTGTDASGNPIYELDRAPTRSEAITVLVKLLGKAGEAGKGGWNIPFTDVPGWAQNFVGYAYANGLTAGTSATTFGGDDLVTASQYITFVLKALGYSANGDFQWDKAWELSDKLGITDGRYNAATKTFVRGDVFMISEAALKIKVKGSEQTLAEKLISAGAFTQKQHDKVYSISQQALTAEEVYAQCSPAVFYIEVYDAKGATLGTGSGFFVNESGVAVTNYHVIDGAYSAKITTSDTQKTYNVLGVYDYSISEDWALIKVDGKDFKYLSIGDEDSVVGGATVFAIGSPLGLQNTISQGLISNPARAESEMTYIQISAAISAGSSGGALINQYGEVIGITSASYVDGQNLNLAISMSYVELSSTAKTLMPLKLIENSTVAVLDPLQYLKDFLVGHGKCELLIGQETIKVYYLEMEDQSGRTFTFSYAPSTETLYIEESYDTRFTSVSTTLYLDGAGCNEYAAKAIFNFRDTMEEKNDFGAAFVSRDTVLASNEGFEFFGWMPHSDLSQKAAESLCYEMILEIISAADNTFKYYNLPITMEDFGYINLE